MPAETVSPGLGRRTCLRGLAAGLGGGWAFGLGFAQGLIAAPAHAHGRSAPSPRVGVPASDPTPGRRILVIGDSFMAGALGRYIVEDLAEARGHHTHRQAKTASGLARPDFYDWFSEARKLVASFAPDLTVVMFGGNDGQSLRMPKGSGSGSSWVSWKKSAAWDAEYRQRIRTFADTLAPQASARRLLWLGMPVMGRPDLHRKVEYINRLFRGEMALRNNAAYVDIWPVLATPSGKYNQYLRLDGERVKVRAGDGVHLTRRGSRHLADYLIPKVHAAATHAEGPTAGLRSLL